MSRLPATDVVVAPAPAVPGPAGAEEPAGPEVPAAGHHAATAAAQFAATVETLHAQRGAPWRAVLVARSMAEVTALSPLAGPRVAIHLDAGGHWTSALRSGRADRVTVLQAGDELTGTDVLARIAQVLLLEPEPADVVVYTDEIERDAAGGSHDVAKPGYLVDTARRAPLYHRLASWPRAVLEALLPPSACDDGAPSAGDPTRLAVRAGEAGHRFVHLPVPAVLGPRASTVTPDQAPPDVDPAEAVSVVVPTAGVRRDVDGEEQTLVLRCLDGLLRRTDHAVAEVVVVLGDNAPDGLAETLTALDPRVRLVHVPGPFNYARAVDVGAAAARSPWLLLLNDDVEVLGPQWLTALLARARVPGTGPVGAKLRFPDGRVQHAGVVHHADGVPFHLGIFEADVAPGEPTSRFALAVSCPFDAVTGACLLVRTADFDLAGGMSQLFPLNFNDADLCLKLAALGRPSVLEPAAVLLHRESSTRVNRIDPAEVDRYRARWADLLRLTPLRQWHLSSRSGL